MGPFPENATTHAPMSAHEISGDHVLSRTHQRALHAAGPGRHPARLTIGAAIVVALFAIVGGAARAQPSEATERANQRCLQCHGQQHIAELNPEERLSMVGTWLGDEPPPPGATTPATPTPAPSPDEPATRPGLYVPADALSKSVHPDLMCVDCHEDAARLPHAPKLNLRTCGASCHSVVYEDFIESSHMDALKRHEQYAPRCATCHGGHDIMRVSQRDAPQYRLNSLYLCGDCHAKHKDEPSGMNPQKRVSSYLASTHARAITEAGLLWAATCVDCHSAHAVHPADDPRSTVYRNNIPDTCAKCHEGIKEIYAKSIHGQLLAKDDPRAPVCTDCHTAHSITRADTPEFMLDIINECGQCHDSPDRTSDRLGTYYKTYRASYHGQVTQLGSIRAARCSDCHGAHDILPPDDPQSRVNKANLVSTCGRCHSGANAKFVEFDPHANYRDAKNYPVLYAVWLYFIIVMSTVFTIFGLHTLLWFIRSLPERRKNGHDTHHDAPTAIKRFSTLNRINHVLVVVTFFGLTATGIPLVFSHEPWAQRIANLVGGIHAAGLWHRAFAIGLIFNFVLHFVGLGVNFHRRTGSWFQWLFGPNSMVPRWKDITDFVGMFRWFVGAGKKPRFDRYAYWEKFDYWAEIFGSLIIGGSGFLLWFPELAARLLPGWAFNVAMIVHGYEALLAICFIFTIHFFNAHLRPGTFPVDEVIFTGTVPEAELKEQRPLEYERLVESGRLESLRVPAPDRARRPLLVVIAVFAVSFGLTLLTLIILGGLDKL